ncbi:MAG: dephospho-CoA kinase [Natronospirillum sp.]|uniref:dephospho-CoA kinase n=1 Tax=Natronospirillum sp. TaxID=2812955 RepID=UPI0025FA2B3E|nr:dephospho-CoA kinase [Natronospirillum sp.]MCH8551347.1 dephospho-CoA kinase [Natronospirillum sp.]
MIAGITGGIGSGKSAVSHYLHEHFSIPVTDADRIARLVVEPGEPAYEAIVRRFPQARQADGNLDRAWLREHVLPDDAARAWLEGVTHPAIRERIRERLMSHQGKAEYQVLDSPLLLETGQDSLCDLVVVVDATEAQQIERTVIRDGHSEALVRSIMAKQWSREQRLQAADLIVDNTGSAEALTAAIETLHLKLQERARHV